MPHVDRVLDLQRTVIMGVLNLTPDSFSDGGSFMEPGAAVEEALRMQAAGAGIVDIGGESTRPGATPVTLQLELDRVMPVIEQLHAECDLPLSIDTSKPEVMGAAVTAGAAIINDVSALRNDGAVTMVAELDVAICLMHSQGKPASMQDDPQYCDVTGEVIQFLDQRVRVCEAAGIKRERLIVDPGFGFGKTREHNFTLLQHLGSLRELKLPIMAGLSRKSMIGDALGLAMPDRCAASITLALLAKQNGANILRVHDVRETVQAVRMLEAVTENSPA